MLSLITPLQPLQQTLDTTGYMLLGYGVLIGMMLLYIISLVVRRRNLERDIEMLRTLSESESGPRPHPARGEARGEMGGRHV
jgi:hypothetical protein